MYRALTWVGVFALCSTLALGGLLFTKIGNTILLPFAQSALNHFLPFQVQLQSLAISLGSMRTDFTINKTLAIALEGEYSLSGSIDMTARIHTLDSSGDVDSSAPLGYLSLQGSATNYTIQSLPMPNNLKAPSSTFKLFARMKLLRIQGYTIELRAVPMEQVAQFFDIDIDTQGTLSISAQAESSTLELRAQSDGLAFGALTIRINNLYYKRDKAHQELAGTLTLNQETLSLLGTNDGEALQTAIYSSRQTPIASAQTQIIDKTLAYSLHITDLATLGGAFGFDINGELELQGKISVDNEIAFSATSSSLGGVSALTLEKNTLKFSGENLSLMRILQLVKAPTILDSTLTITSVYNLAFHKGTINIEGQNFAILLDDLGAYGLEAFDTQNNAQDAWGVGFENARADSTISLDGQLERAQINAQATIKTPDQSLHTSKCIINLATQSLDVEFLESSITLQGKLNQMQAPPTNKEQITQETQEDLQAIYESQETMQEETEHIQENLGV